MTMETTNNSPINTDHYRKLVQTYLNMHVYQSALFWADKVVALTGSPRDVYCLAQCMYALKQYHRASHLMQSRGLDRTYILCHYLTVKCLLEAREMEQALQAVESFDLDSCIHNNTQNDSYLFDDSPKNKIFAAVLLLKGKVFETMDNRGPAADCYKQALHYDVYCYEAFDSLLKYQMLSAAEESELLKALPIRQQCGSPEEADLVRALYQSKMKKYQTPQSERIATEPPKILLSTPTEFLVSLSNTPSFCGTSTPSFSCRSKKLVAGGGSYCNTPDLDDGGDKAVGRIKRNSLDWYVSEAERLFYNCDYQKCGELTDAVLREDPYHCGCLPVHISCQVELKQSTKLFALAHKLVDLYPEQAISWYAVGCYYYIIGKNLEARRFLSKATSLDRLFGPAWLAYGHSFAIENEHDQAMAAYFKASQLMRGCHLPLLYIGLECGLTNNVKLADKFFKQAQDVAPEDPFVMHEMGVIAFQNGAFKTAEKYFRDALQQVRRIRPGGTVAARFEPLLNNLGHTCRKLKKYEEAADFHRQALFLAPHCASTYSALAFDHALMGHVELAIEWFHKALGLKNDDSFCTSMLNYLMEQATEEERPFFGAPLFIPKFELPPARSKTGDASKSGVMGTKTTENEDNSWRSEGVDEISVNNEANSMSMSIEDEMPDAGGIIRE